MIHIYGIPNCDIVKKAFSWFKENDIPFTFHNFKTGGVDAEKLSAWINKSGIDVVVNKRSTTWRNLGAVKQAMMSDISKAIEIIRSEPSIIKRPIIEHSKTVTFGFDEQTYRQKFVKS